MAIKKGDKVKVEYTGTLEDGTVFDTSEGKQPLEFEVGTGKVIKGFDEALVGMEKDGEKAIKLKPEEDYGAPQDNLMQTIPREKLPKEPEPKPGMGIMLSTQEGKQFPARIAEVSEKDIKIDLNHPLAGKTLNFKIKVVEC